MLKTCICFFVIFVTEKMTKEPLERSYLVNIINGLIEGKPGKIARISIKVLFGAIVIIIIHSHQLVIDSKIHLSKIYS